ncbi:hypothetical protein Slin14017_G091700 [Septoria linicola]|nr:hypothetical protein Slin14017_G091700 [Septoria linicola]
MFLLRTSRTAFVARVVPSSTVSRAPFSTIPRCLSGSDYGSGAQKGDKALEKESLDKEHPGPPPPSTGGSKSSQSSQPSSSEQSWGSGDGSKAQPKIFSDSRPKEGSESEEVRQHNEEHRQRADRAQEGVKENDKVSKEFWKGQGGVDRDP